MAGSIAKVAWNKLMEGSKLSFTNGYIDSIRKEKTKR